MRLFVFFVLFVCAVLLAFGVEAFASIGADGAEVAAGTTAALDAGAEAQAGWLRTAWICLGAWFGASFLLGAVWASCALLLGRGRREEAWRSPAEPRVVLRSVPLPEART